MNRPHAPGSVGMRAVGERVGEATTFTTIGVVHRARGQWDQALALSEQSVAE